MTNNHSELNALELSARITLEDDGALRLEQSLLEITDWPSFIAALESNGLAPLFHSHLQSHEQLNKVIPKVAHLQIKALVIRHQRATEAREIAVAEILQHFNQVNIECIALKGLALAYSIYPSASLRPMRDIDLLVHSDQALAAQQCLRDLGYSAENRKDGAMYNHHHLPVAMKVIDGMNMSIEIHHNALSGDVAQSISYADLTDPPLSVSIGEHITNRLGHTDTLRHLCHHSFEPALRIKLGSLHDVMRYAAFYQQEINWDDIRAHYPFVINTLRCIHFVIALPQTLLAQIDLPTSPAPAQAGEGYQPLSYSLAQYRGVRRWQHIFQAPAWWAHVFYHVPPEQSLFWVKWLRHPLQIILWLSRRYWAILLAKWA